MAEKKRGTGFITFTNGVITLLIAAKGPPCRKLQGICHLGTYRSRLLVVDFSLAPPPSSVWWKCLWSPIVQG